MENGYFKGKGVLKFNDSTYLYGTFNPNPAISRTINKTWVSPGVFKCEGKFMIYYGRNINSAGLPLIYSGTTKFNTGEILKENNNTVSKVHIDFTDSFGTKYSGTSKIPMFFYSLMSINDENASYDRRFVSGTIQSGFSNDKVSGNYNYWGLRTGSITYTWTSNNDKFTASYNGVKRNSKIKFIFSDGSKVKAKYKNGIMTNITLPNGLIIDLSKPDFIKYSSFDSNTKIKLSRILIVHYEDLIIQGNHLKAREILFNTRNLVKGTNIENDYNYKSLLFFLQKNPIYVLTQYTKSELFWFRENITKARDFSNILDYANAYKYLLQAAKHFSALPYKYKKALYNVHFEIFYNTSIDRYTDNYWRLYWRTGSNELTEQIKATLDLYEKTVVNERLFELYKGKNIVDNLLHKYEHLDTLVEKIISIQLYIEKQGTKFFSNYDYGIYYQNNFDYKNAIRYLKNAVDNYPEKSTVFSLGTAYYINKDFENALKYFNASLKLIPNNPYVYYWLGKTYSRLNNNNKSSFYFKEALKFTNDKYITAFANAYLGNSDKAVNLLNSLKNTKYKLFQGLYYMELASIYSITNNTDESLDAINKSVNAGFKFTKYWLEYNDNLNNLKSAG